VGDKMRTIKRYRNRKLYDLTERGYVNLTELTEIVRSGEDVVVVDALSGVDLTSQILAQIIFEEERRHGPKLDLYVYRTIIREGLVG
jgi:polyhydroxyalkanoate synthesis repressor PhaR